MSYRMDLTQPVLLDVDGVLLDTTDFFDSVWRRWAQLIGLDDDWISALARGRRSEDVLAPMASWLDISFERRRLNDLTLSQLDRVQPVDGAPLLLDALRGRQHALVTSGSRWFVELAFARLGLPLPPIRVYAEDVTAGKPAPDCYLLAAQQLGVDPRTCIAVDDTEAGVTAATAAGCQVIAVGPVGDLVLPAAVATNSVRQLAQMWSVAERIA